MKASTKQMTRRQALGFGAFAAVSLLAACGGEAAPTGTTAPSAPVSGASVPPTRATATTGQGAVAASTASASPVARPALQGKIQVMRGTGQDQYWNDRAADFKARTGVTAEMIITTGNVDDGTIPTALKSGSGPDVVNVNSGPSRVGFLAQAGLIRPLVDAYATYNWEARLVPAALERLKNQGQIYQGKIWEFPATIDVIYWNYNKDIFAKVGINPPTTFDDMNANFERLKAAGIYPILLGARSNTPPGWLFGNILQATAGRDAVADALFGSGKWDQPAFVQAAQVLGDWNKKQYIAPATTALTDQESVPVFVNKQAATYCVGTWAIPTYTDQNADLANIDSFVTPKITPTGSALPTGGFGNSWVIAAESKNPAAAAAWIDYLFSDDVVKLNFDNPRNGNIPTVNVPTGVVPKTPLLSKAVDTLARVGSGYNPSVHLPAAVTSVYFESLQGIVTGLLAPEKAMANIEAARVKATQS